MKRYLGAATILLLAGCLNTEPSAITLVFDLDDAVGQDWTPGVANIPADRLADVNLDEGFRPLPASVAATNGLYLAGTNVTGDLLIYEQKRFTGLFPNQTYSAELTAVFATDIHAGCSTGVGPGTVIKAGASMLALSQAPDAQGILRLTHDLGDFASAGDFTRLGDIRNSLAGCPTPGTFSSRTTITQTQQVTVTTDIDGGFVLFVGMHSSALGRAEIYIISIRLVLI